MMALAAGAAGALYMTVTSPTEGSKRCFNDASPGVASITCVGVGAMYHNVTWTSSTVPGSTKSWVPGDDLPSTTLRFTALPSSNSSFGDQWVKCTIDEQPELTDTNHYKVFFAEEATNNPGGTMPNWYYYWKQTSAYSGSPGYDPNHSGYGYTGWKDGAWVSCLGTEANESFTPPEGDNSGNLLEGIDLFAYTCRHEYRHRSLRLTWFPNGPEDVYQYDNDQDGIKDSVEGSLGENVGGPFDPQWQDTDDDGRPDGEDYVYNTQSAWTEGAADSQDWACPGHQY